MRYLLSALTLGMLLSAAFADDLRETVAALTSPELAGRQAGTVEERLAAELIAGWFEEAGVQPAVPGWLQEFPWQETVSANVLGVIPGRGDLAGRWLVIGAHLDHLGRVDRSASGVPASGDYYPGAGENASGVAALLRVVRRLGDRDDHESTRSVLVCAFGAEEVGLVGSRHLAANLPVPRQAVDAMINLDAVGRLGSGPLHVAGASTAQELSALLADAAGDVPLVLHEPRLLGSDHLSFLDLGVPSLFFFTDAYPEMNSPADDLFAVDLPGLAKVAEVTVSILANLRTTGASLDFVPPAAVERPAGGNRDTWFGSAPDFSGVVSDQGYLIGGVAEGGPAAVAGLRQGDVLVSLGGETVVDLASFTQRLRSFDPGEMVEVEVLRDGRRLDFLVTLGHRSQR